MCDPIRGESKSYELNTISNTVIKNKLILSIQLTASHSNQFPIETNLEKSEWRKLSNGISRPSKWYRCWSMAITIINLMAIRDWTKSRYFPSRNAHRWDEMKRGRRSQSHSHFTIHRTSTNLKFKRKEKQQISKQNHSSNKYMYIKYETAANILILTDWSAATLMPF